MPRLTASLWIDAAPERVFAICQAPSIPLLPPGGPRLVVLDEPGVVGSRYRWEFRRLGLNGRLDSVVTESQPGTKLAFRGTAGWEMEADLALMRENGGTRLLFRMQYRFPFPFRWLLPGGLLRLGVWHALNQVKTLAEEPMPVRAFSPS
ncbi:MAG: SRPBCC family protein [Bacillota bacterium]